MYVFLHQNSLTTATGQTNVHHEIVLFRLHGDTAYLVNTRDSTMEDAWTVSHASTAIYLLEDVASGAISAIFPKDRAVSYNISLFCHSDIASGKRAIAID